MRFLENVKNMMRAPVTRFILAAATLIVGFYSTLKPASAAPKTIKTPDAPVVLNGKAGVEALKARTDYTFVLERNEAPRTVMSHTLNNQSCESQYQPKAYIFDNKGRKIELPELPKTSVGNVYEEQIRLEGPPQILRASTAGLSSTESVPVYPILKTGNVVDPEFTPNRNVHTGKRKNVLDTATYNNICLEQQKFNQETYRILKFHQRRQDPSWNQKSDQDKLNDLLGDITAGETVYNGYTLPRNNIQNQHDLLESSMRMDSQNQKSALLVQALEKHKHSR
jgi:hypothetical protein